ncbi:hypothetical protein Tco_0582094, partial [Tanacetum coccineum]
LQPCLEQLSVPIYHANVNAIVGETSLSFALLKVPTRAEGAKKHAAALRQLMVDIVSHPLSSQNLLGEASTSAVAPCVEDLDTDKDLGSVVCTTTQKRLFHEGRFITPSFIEANNMLPSFQAIGFRPFLTLDEPICPRFVAEFYHSLEVKRDEEERPYIEFKLGQFTFDHFFGLKHDLVRKNITIPKTTQTELQRDPNKLHIDDLHPELRGWELFLKENFFCTIGNRDHINMDSPPQSPNHVFNFPENEEEFEEDPQEDPEEEVEEWDDMDIIEEDPEEDPEEWDDVDAAEQVDEIPHPVTPPRNPTAVPHSSPEQSSESEDNDLANPDEAQDVSPPKSTYEIGSTSNAHATVSAPMIITSVDEPVSQVEELSRNVHYLLRESGIKGKEAKVLKIEMKKLAKRMGSWDEDFKNEWLYTCKLEKKLCEVEDKVEKKEKEKVEMKKYITELEKDERVYGRDEREVGVDGL